MTVPTASAPAASKRVASNGSSRKKHRLRSGTGEANRIAVAILEVLAGLRTPAEAAQSLQISVPRYYVLETRALEGLVAACEPKPLGKQRTPQTRIAALEKELQQARHQCARQQALVRAAQRTVGLRFGLHRRVADRVPNREASIPTLLSCPAAPIQRCLGT